MTPCRRLAAQCLLALSAALWSAACAALVLPKVTVLARQSFAHLAEGDLSAGMARMTELQRLLRTDSGGHPAALGVELQGSIARLAAAQESIERNAARAEALRLLAQVDPLGARLAPPPPTLAATFGVRATLAGVTARLNRAVPRIVVVEAGVKAFSSAFRNGAASSDLFLSIEAITRPDVAPLIQAWRNTPKHKRLYVIGGRGDAGYVESLRAQYAAEGYTTFFYRDCGTALCSEAGVGAFFGSAGQVIVLDTPAARNSAYVQVEVRVANELSGTGPSVYIIGADDLGNAVRSADEGVRSATAVAVARQVSCTGLFVREFALDPGCGSVAAW